MDEVIDDLISLESGFNDGGLDCMEPNIIMQNNVSMNHINYSYMITLFKKKMQLTLTWTPTHQQFEGLLYWFLQHILFVNLLTSLQWGLRKVKYFKGPTCKTVDC